MKSKWLLSCSCLVLLAGGCKKDTNVAPNSAETSLSAKTTFEEFTLNNEFQDNMVVQRDKPLAIWGKATTNTRVTINVSWNSESLLSIADGDGNWSVTVPAATANTNAQTITCHTDAGATTIKISNVLIGDVWLAVGQSNMVMPIAPNLTFAGVVDYEQEIQAAQYPLIRFQTVQENFNSPLLDYFGNTNPWEICSPSAVGHISAVAYFFARKLHTTLNIPLGIIVSAVDGSSCYDWWSGGQYYGGMINPLTKLSIKGFIWYQGETDEHMSPVNNYTDINSRMIQAWRKSFAQGVLPFYFVQLTPFSEDDTDPYTAYGSLSDGYLARFREAQANVLSTPGTGMAVTMDVGDPANHHPIDKKPVGERLALLALKNTYNINAACNGPRYLSYTQSGGILTINYATGTATGLTTLNNGPLNQLFFVAGANTVFYNATAQISGNTIVLTIPDKVSGPVVSVRYAFCNAQKTNLQNGSGLPAEPFRTDNW